MQLTLVFRLVPVLFLLATVGCQQPRSSLQKGPTPLNEQVEQLASVVAGTKYLKYKCNRSDLPSDAVIDKVAYKVAKQRGWNSSSYGALPQRSEEIYQSLMRDNTPEQTKCSSFNSLLAPFTAELRADSSS
ncbi:type II secretion system pilot lipoprotein GspS [Serratia fonticola]|uniref:type II secretion system pilot lipoprotein GspS n=1 Tax=Serratia fonticola TaxID=47917 RepID=UPI0027F1EA98|nr:type II secretion system pilot lipoprotein GspS [Serratia fonticola]MDQ7208829.1 type II secretion system pilot lipoprotein GspS [Serratia fonticola]HBE9078906.1 type II secretion system pilot lipoprotein GspS [Serratia fonticola]HBE9089395.1 type II secretion system pilot lipoprotein GspS [Serratia fonticola]HBE9152115.1 type II secretion system pilot lipoprotein GspS [Serratia fonticola]